MGVTQYPQLPPILLFRSSHYDAAFAGRNLLPAPDPPQWTSMEVDPHCLDQA